MVHIDNESFPLIVNGQTHTYMLHECSLPENAQEVRELESGGNHAHSYEDCQPQMSIEESLNTIDWDD